MTAPEAQFWGALLAFVGSVVVAFYTARKAKQSTDQATGAKLVEEALDQMRATIEQQGKDIESLRSEVAGLRGSLEATNRVLRAAVNFIDRVGNWLQGGMKGKQPAPSEILHEHIDMDPWAVPGIGGTD